MDIPLARRRDLRRNATDAERVPWFQFRAKRFAGFKFRRQHSCGRYILDFYCPARTLAIELDGGQHFDPAKQAYDERRTEQLQKRGVRVLRFPNDLVFGELDAVLEAIAAALEISDGPGIYIFTSTAVPS
ncbi:MAG TPA: endonuclease domain-containing protein [Polyangia bacterium]|nr:endonuclease domain-containing protein [Polyangia bacterium]